MIRNIFTLFICLLLISATAPAQNDAWPGTWEMEYTPAKNSPAVHMRLQIAEAEKNVLYPAQISLQCDSFSASYALLLVKKSSRELAISKNKYAVSEKPFSLSNATFFINGIFDNSRDAKGNPLLTLNRMQTKHQSALRLDTLKANRPVAEQLLAFLRDADIKLSKSNSIPWAGNYSDRITSPSQSPAYFGLLDTVYVSTRDGVADFSSYNKNDIVSASLNGKLFIDQLYLDRKAYHEELLLDTGTNIMILFAENFQNQSPNKGRMEFEFGKKKMKVDFSRKDDSAAVFIAARICYELDRNKEIHFEEYDDSKENPLKQNQKMIGSVKAVSKQLTLAVWDDAVEDGDSISVNINNNWVAKGLPVKKNPQFITVTLQPGPNTITFVGDNVGSIPPNTSVLEIIDGKKRKSFLLETVPGEDNLLKIYYDIKPE